MKKKIMLITPMLHQGGFERICVMTARLLEEKYEVYIAVFSMKDVAFDISGLKVIDLGLESRPGKAAKILNVFKRSSKLSRIQRKLGIDVSYSFGTTANIANSLSRGAKKKITACHSFEEIKSKGYMKLISRLSDKVLCCSKKMADLVENTYHFSNVQAMWNPCDVEKIRRQSLLCDAEDLSFWKTNDKVLVSMGREDDVKGFWHLLKVFRKVTEERKDVRLAIIGDGSFEEYRKLVKDLRLEDKVLFAGLKKNPFPYLKESDLYLLTSISEGLPNALVEALAVSLPIVSVNCLSGPAEILHRDFKAAENKTEVFEADYGVLTPVLSPEKNLQVIFEETEGLQKIKLEQAEGLLAEGILKLLNDEKLYGKYRNLAEERAKDFSAETYIKELISCMEAL